MTYQEWFDNHARKHRAIVAKLSHLSDHEVIEYFRFENMVEKEREFCLLYADNKKCHEIEHLNCYWCACPYFRFNDEGLSIDEGITTYSKCSIDAKEGSQFHHDTSIHQDCTNCLIPHKEATIEKQFDRNWEETMGKAPPDLDKIED